MIQKTSWARVAGSWRPSDSQQQNARKRHSGWVALGPGVVCSTAILFGLLVQSELRLPGSTKGMAAAQSPDLHMRTVDQTKSPVCLFVDATKHAADIPEAYKALCARLAKASGVTPAGLPGDSTAVDHSSATEPDWYLWAQLNNQCSGSEAPADSKQFLIYATHSEAGGAVCISSSSSEQTPYVLKLRLPKGVFRIERLAFKPAPIGGNGSGADAAGPGQGALRVGCSDLTRLEGCDNAEADTISKSGDLAPGEVAIIRYTDVARAARVSFSDLKSELHNLAVSTPGPAARLRRIVSEGNGYLSGITQGTSATCQRRLGCVHRLILLMSQAESLHRNYQSRQSVNSDPGAKTMGAIERLEDSLAETSAVLTGLVPQIELGPFTRSQQTGAGDAPQDRTVRSVVTVSLRNTGPHSVESVKLGLDSAALPEGSICTPDDPAYFGSLRPGQAVRAKFTLKLPESAQAAPARFVADVSYFAAGAPAHLRPRPW